MAKFEEAYERLNKEQRLAVDTIAGPVMVIAGPGTGKTEVLTVRIANILQKTKVAPERILALTFTEAGAATMRRRLADLVGRDAYQVEISTFHAFANGVIRDYPDSFPEIASRELVAEIDQVRVVERVIDGLSSDTLRPFGDRYHYLRPVLRAIAELKKQGIAPEKFQEIATREDEQFQAIPDLINASGKYEGKMKTKYLPVMRRIARNGELAIAYAAYEKKLHDAKQYDYDDMIMAVATALEHDEDMRRTLQDAYDYFLVDEHQDTNNAQNKIIELVAGGTPPNLPSERGGTGPNLFAVGDEKQAIYRFQGASIENFHYFETRYPKAKLIALTSNYRSTQAILDAAEAVSPRKDKLAAHQKKGAVGPAHFAEFSTSGAECAFVASRIKELWDAGKIKLEDIAVLYRDNRDAESFVRMFEKEEIPFRVESDSNALEDEDIKKLVRLLRVVEHFGKDPELAIAVHIDFLGIAPLDAYKFFAAARRERRSLYDILRSRTMLEQAGIETIDPFSALFDHLSKWKRDAENCGALVAFENIVRESGFLIAVLENPLAMEKLAKLHALFDLLKSFVEQQKNYTLRNFFEHLALMEEHGVGIKSNGPVLPGRVRLMTAHRAKGQEFEIVFVVNAIAKKWGDKSHRNEIRLPAEVYVLGKGVAAPVVADGDDNEEADDDADERNVFYVALTRAKHELWITASKTSWDGREQVPTKFIADLGEEVLPRYATEKFETSYAAHLEKDFAAPEPKTPELKDKEFLNALFKEQGLSPTALNNYLECPWKYFYRNLVRIPEAPNKHLAFGNAVHAALKSYFDAFDDGKKNDVAWLVAQFEAALAKQPIVEDEYEEALEKGHKALTAYYKEYHEGWTMSGSGKNEFPITGVLVGDIPIGGKLDRIVFAKGSDEVTVFDYKTGKAKSRNEIEGGTKDADGNYLRQLTFYKLLLEKQGSYRMEQGILDFVEPDMRGKFSRYPFMITDGAVRILEQQIKDVAKEIEDLAFWDKYCDDPQCDACALRKMMK